MPRSANVLDHCIEEHFIVFMLSLRQLSVPFTVKFTVLRFATRRSLLGFHVGVCACTGLFLIPAQGASAQAFTYPSLQLPTSSIRDYTAAIASGGGTSVLFQWREGIGEGMHVGLDAGFADPKNSSSLRLFVGGSVGRELLRATGDQPLDLLVTGGVGAAFGGGSTLFRVPVGVSVGHTFALDDGMSITPYAHPRLSIDVCQGCSGSASRSALGLDFDLGASFQVNREFAVRAAGSFTGSNRQGSANSFAVGLNWTPGAVKRVGAAVTR